MVSFDDLGGSEAASDPVSIMLHRISLRAVKHSALGTDISKAFSKDTKDASMIRTRQELKTLVVCGLLDGKNIPHKTVFWYYPPREISLKVLRGFKGKNHFDTYW